jgi:K+-transporting ATPase ATPase A chain
MMTSETIFGGCGSGLSSLLIYIIVTIFFSGLIIGRTPDYLGNKISALDIKLTMIILLCYGLTILGLTAFASVSKWGSQGLANSGPHGFSEILYAYTSCAANNGSAFSGLAANSPAYNLTLSLAMLLGRFGTIVPVLALAGSFASKKKVSRTPSNLLIHGSVFTLFLVGIIIIFGALTFIPALVMGPFLEHFFMIRGTLF